MKAVGDVFMFKQTSLEFEAGCLGPDGHPQPFKFTMLYEVIRQLHATPELMFMAWSQSLDYNIGTAAHSFAAMTALCEKFSIRIGDFMCTPPEGDVNTLKKDITAAGPSQMSPSLAKPPRTHSMTDNEYAELEDTWRHQIKQQQDLDRLLQLPRLMNLNGVSHADRLKLLQGFERQRRATSQYRHSCTVDGNADLEFGNPEEVIEQVMKRHGNPPDLEPDAVYGPKVENCIPMYTSTILASTVQIATMYEYQSLVKWCSDDEVRCGDGNLIGNAFVGSKSHFAFSERNMKGPSKFNTAWLRQDGKDGWRSFASSVITSNVTCKIFDLPMNGLRDLFYLLSTRDNARRCCEEPHLPSNMQKNFAFTDGKTVVTEDYSGNLRMRGVLDKREANPKYHPLTHFQEEMRPRHPYACVHDDKAGIQRSLDFATMNGRLPAVMPMISNNVRDAAPVRIISENDKKFVELNTAAAVEHTKMVAEAAIRCSMHPGTENLQETFCDGAQGPNGLKVESAEGTPVGNCTTMAYSYDLLSISLTIDAMQRYYNPNAASYVKLYNDAYGDTLKVNFKVSKLPHMIMRFVGYEETKSRKLLSMPVKENQSPAFNRVDVSDQHDENEPFHVVHTHLQLSLGHEPSEEEIDRYIRSRAGSRSMSGIEGDLLSMTTYIEHTLTTLKERGMVESEDDVVMHLVADEPYGLRTRVAEIAGHRINQIVDKHPEVKKAAKALPPAHHGMSEEKLAEFREVECHRIRHKLYNDIELPEHLDDLRMYAPLNVGTMAKMTFANRSEDEARLRDLKDKKRAKPVDASTQFKDQSRFVKRTLPSGGNVLRARGIRDSRKELAHKRKHEPEFALGTRV